MIRVLLFGAAAVAAVLFSIHVYRAREARVQQGALLTTLRATALVLALALIWDPAIPLGDTPGGGPWVLLDASASMAVPDGAGETAWTRALAELDGEGEARILTFGDEVRPEVDPAAGAPTDRGSVLAPALQAAVEGGAESVLLLSDMRIEDPVAAAEIANALQVPFETRDLGGDLRNVGIVDLTIAGEFGSRDSVPGEVVLSREGGGEDTVTVEIRASGEPVASVAATGLTDSAPARIPFWIQRPPDGVPEVPVSVRVRMEGDQYGDDDVRTAVVRGTSAERPLVLVSLRPDWESRFLLPVLEQVTGLRSAGFIQLSGDRWMPVSAAAATATDPAGGITAADSVRALAERAELLVLHGMGSAIPGWVAEAAGSASRLIVLADQPAGAALVGESLIPGTSGASWFVSAELPSSPVAQELAGLRPEPLPPLEGVLVTDGPRAMDRAALTALRDGRGDPTGVLFVGEDGGRRWALAPARGFWRWAIRPGEGREAYRRVWSAASGWVLRGEGSGAGASGPAQPVVASGDPVRWMVPDDSARLRIERDSEPVLDTVIAAAEGGTAVTPPLPAGSYLWTVAGPDGEATGRGSLEVEPRSNELLHARWTPPEPAAGPSDGDDELSAGRGLRTHPLPFVLLLGILSAEWMLRRRRGLR